MRKYNWERKAMLLLSGALLLSACACGKKAEVEMATETDTTQQEVIETKDVLGDYVAPGVKLPDQFDLMIYPMEAVTLECYTKGIPYYTEGEEEESFWFSMAVLSSLLAENNYVQPVFDENYYYYTKEEIKDLASVLYGEYEEGNMPMAELDEENPYAFYEEDMGLYGLLNGNIGDLHLYIAGCEEYADGYLLDTQLKKGDGDNVIAQFQIDLQAKKKKDAKALFHYSIYEVYSMDEEDDSSVDEFEDDGEELQGPTAEGDFDEVDGKEIEEPFEEETPEKQVLSGDSSYSNEKNISKQEALELAKDYLGDDVDFTYKQMVTIGDYEYFDFAVKSDKHSVTDVLVCRNGLDVVSGIQNSDGSWTFDQ